ncbi:MAG TPA: LPS export ABC transporter ATP-binding protein [Candidatus Hydrogenedentes bacterium]|nr:LPS export ABC transporter ATP-binding protein [Candidatus Hydrogenedentota bacterium]HOH42249.1 LPS export ABC transporter ATP-binding protein [Candidatus Hydrogenedentota bacterium]HOM47352.1 LPS export ABC transporter ATP-binding protein [Candidatus Hydrogenedentota bacterium]HOR50902.1 LPS export ABC transporter ATP-binding protein [Candidatus Hydrogenedentota bacterium]HPK24593.1 LPS export ABC transporter ATP-binding protein [Candidatus Hydrogenedentota bacterium]
MSEQEALLYTDAIRKSFKKRTVVRDVSISLNAGEVVGLLGPNGAGKTTSFSMIVGLLKPDQGRILFLNHDVTPMPMYRRARAGMAYLPQEPSVFQQLTVRQNLQVVLENQKISRKEIRERIDLLLSEMNITHLADSPAFTLSGGERRRTEIARALAIQPKVFLLDEPFAGIDPIAVADLQQIVRNLKELGIGVLITDHNVRDTLEITDRAYIINEGTVLATGSPQDIAENPVVRQIYLGEKFKLDNQQ